MSVVISCFDRVDGLRAAVEALEQQTFSDFELCIVDQTGNDELRAIAAATPVRTRYVECIPTEPSRRGRKPSNASRARNAGVLAASAPIVAFTDDDCVPESAWVEKITEPLRRDPAVILVAGTNAVPPTDRTGREEAILELEILKPPPRTPMFRGQAGASSLAVRRDTFLEIGGFDPALGPGTPLWGSEDQHLIYRFQRYAERTGRQIVARRDAISVDQPCTGRMQNIIRIWRYMRSYGMFLRREYELTGAPVAQHNYRFRRNKDLLAIWLSLRARNLFWAIAAMTQASATTVGWLRGKRLQPFVPEVQPADAHETAC